MRKRKYIDATRVTEDSNAIMVVKIVFLTLAIVLFAMFAYDMAYSAGLANSGDYCEVWVLCQPDDYINIRLQPSRKSEIIGWAESGMSFKTDMREKNNYLHIIEFGEFGEGWIHTGYIDYSKAERVNAEAKIVSGGRVRARKMINGKRRCWLNPGQTVMVYWSSMDWAVTNKGYIQTIYLEGWDDWY